MMATETTYSCGHMDFTESESPEEKSATLVVRRFVLCKQCALEAAMRNGDDRTCAHAGQNFACGCGL